METKNMFFKKVKLKFDFLYSFAYQDSKINKYAVSIMNEKNEPLKFDKEIHFFTTNKLDEFNSDEFYNVEIADKDKALKLVSYRVYGSDFFDQLYESQKQKEKLNDKKECEEQKQNLKSDYVGIDKLSLNFDSGKTLCIVLHTSKDECLYIEASNIKINAFKKVSNQ